MSKAIGSKDSFTVICSSTKRSKCSAVSDIESGDSSATSRVYRAEVVLHFVASSNAYMGIAACHEVKVCSDKFPVHVYISLRLCTTGIY